MIGTGAFHNCTGLTGNLIIPASVTQLGYGVFYECTGLTGNVVIPDTVTSWNMPYTEASQPGMFLNCTAITGIKLSSNTLHLIGGGYSQNGSFRGCSGINTEIVVPILVTKIGPNVFNGCTNLPSMRMLPISPPTLANISAFANTNNCPIYVPASSVDAYKEATNWSALASRIFAIPE